MYPTTVSVSFTKQKQPIFWLTKGEKLFYRVQFQNRGAIPEFWQKANGSWNIVLRKVIQTCQKTRKRKVFLCQVRATFKLNKPPQKLSRPRVDSNMVISYFGRKRNQVWRKQQLCFQNMQINITIQNLIHLHDTSKL